MSLTELFIHRRIGTLLLAVAVILLGAVAYTQLPVAPLPQVDFPTIVVQAKLPGASAETMATTVATPLENQLSNISGVTQMTSSSSLGSTSIALQFDLDRNIDGAAQDVQTAINAASGKLPKNLPSAPTYRKANPADAAIVSLAVTSDTLPITALSQYVNDKLIPQLSQLSGVGLVDYHGLLNPAIRLQIDPNKLAALNLTMEDVRTAVNTQTVNAPKGTLNSDDRTIILNTTDQITAVEEYRNVVVAYRSNAPIYLKDLAAVITAGEDIRQGAWLQGKHAVIMDIHKQAGFNVIDTIQNIKDKLPKLTATLPASAHLSIVGDRTQTIQASVHDVQFTLILTIILVVTVIFVFLRNLWATVIPGLAIPLSLVATFGVMYLLDYSLDNLSLMGLSIAIGFVVDDAIVVIENIMRHIEEGKSKLQAAIIGVNEVRFTIISMTISLIAVFIPILLMSGIVGRLLREFAVTVSLAILASAVVSLTFTPMLCAWVIPSKRQQKKPGRFSVMTERYFLYVTEQYMSILNIILKHRVVTLVVMLSTLVMTAVLFVAIPKGFFPETDTGILVGQARAASNISFQTMTNRMETLGQVIEKDPDVDNVYYWIGSSPSLSIGRLSVNLKPFDERSTTAHEVLTRLTRAAAAIPDIKVNLQVRQDLQVGGRMAAAQYQYTLQDSDLAELTQWTNTLTQKLATLPQLRDVSSDLQSSTDSLTLDIDRNIAAKYGITAQAIDDTLYDAFGQRQIATMFTQQNQYHVIQEIAPEYQRNKESLSHLYVRSPLTTELVPLTALGRIVEGTAPVTVNHQGIFPAATISFNLIPGYSLGDAVNAIHQMETDLQTPNTLTGTFQGTAQVFQSSLKSTPWLILSAVIAIYIILGILYESAIHPLTIISTLPSAALGALIALIICNQDLSIMGIIGIILLIGIVKKNAIMMIDFALVAEREQGLSPLESIKQACHLRFRPIMMTTMAALFGAIPLALGTGPGSELRQPLGISIIGGLLVSQVLTLFTTPVIYLWFESLRQWVNSKRHQPEEI